MIAIFVGVSSVLGRNLVRVLLSATFPAASVPECVSVENVLTLLTPHRQETQETRDESGDEEIPASAPALLVFDVETARALLHASLLHPSADEIAATLAQLPIVLISHNATDDVACADDVRARWAAAVTLLNAPFAPERLLELATTLAPQLQAARTIPHEHDPANDESESVHYG